MTMSTHRDAMNSYDVIIVGAGFAGMYMLHLVRSIGMSAIVLETGDGVGGTWYWNRYPGARCDVESMQYSYSFSEELQQEWCWSEKYSSQPEILAYANHVAKKFDLYRDIEFSTRVTSATFREDTSDWSILTDRGTRYTGRYCVMATGCLSASQAPHIKGIESFAGAVYHTGTWPQGEVDLAGKRVGVIGTGSSGIQVIPELARMAKELHVFQRTPNYSVPARNRPMDPDYQQAWKDSYKSRRDMARTRPAGILSEFGAKGALEVSAAERHAEYERRWQAGGTDFMAAYTDLLLDEKANDTAAEYVRDRIRHVVEDKDLANRLIPNDYPIGSKRLCADSGYFETFNRPNVHLVDLRQNGIECIEEDGVRTAEGKVEIDTLVLATGFDAMTGALSRIDIVGRQGQPLRDKWADGPNTLLGLMTCGFPNMFLVTGPGSPSVMTNVIVAIEDNVKWIADCLAHLQASGRSCIEPAASAEAWWMTEVAAATEGRLYTKVKSWYLGSNVPGKPPVFLPYVGGLPKYQAICDEVAREGYRGFEMR